MVKFLRWRGSPGLSRRAQWNHKSPYGREASESKGDVRTKQRLKRDNATSLAMKVEERAMSKGI